MAHSKSAEAGDHRLRHFFIQIFFDSYHLLMAASCRRNHLGI